MNEPNSQDLQIIVLNLATLLRLRTYWYFCTCRGRTVIWYLMRARAAWYLHVLAATGTGTSSVGPYFLYLVPTFLSFFFWQLHRRKLDAQSKGLILIIVHAFSLTLHNSQLFKLSLSSFVPFPSLLFGRPLANGQVSCDAVRVSGTRGDAASSCRLRLTIPAWGVGPVRSWRCTRDKRLRQCSFILLSPDDGAGVTRDVWFATVSGIEKTGLGCLRNTTIVRRSLKGSSPLTNATPHRHCIAVLDADFTNCRGAIWGLTKKGAWILNFWAGRDFGYKTP